MYHNLLYITLIAIFFLSCKNDKQFCQKKIDFLINNNNNTDFTNLIGISASARGKHDNGKWKFYRIVYSDLYKNSYEIIVEVNNNEEINIESNTKDFSTAINSDVKNQDSIVIAIVLDVQRVFNEFGIYEMNSNLYLGEFIEFKYLPTNCSVYYLKKGAQLNSDYTTYFNEAEKIGDNWYKLKFRNTKTTLTSWPENMELPDNLK